MVATSGRAESSVSSGVPSAETAPVDATPEPVQLVLEITRGRTRFPTRPVTGERYLIGAGVTCDLRLGGDGIPVLHSIVTVHGAEIRIEAISPAPALVVNGRTVREAPLADGDRIAIGEVEICTRLAGGHRPVVPQAAVPIEAAVDVADRPVSELSAAELVDLIETEERRVDEFEARRQTGARALTQALRARSDRAGERRAADSSRSRAIPAPHFLSKRPQVLAARGRSVDAGESPADDNLIQELDEMRKQLTLLSQELRQNAQRASAREAEYVSATELLMETQQSLMSRFESLLSHVEQLQQQKSNAGMTRAIA